MRIDARPDAVQSCGMASRSSFVQIRVTPAEKARLRRLAEAAGRDISSYVLARALPPNRLRFRELMEILEGEGDAGTRLALAELNDFLAELAPVESEDALADADLSPLSPFVAAYVAAMVEVACHGKGAAPPPWTGRVPALPVPWFASPLRGHRLHLLRTSPVPFRRRNLFVDASIGARV
jgi:uncharacterized protein (DUF1778 family)